MRRPFAVLMLLTLVLACGCKKESENFLPVYTHESLADSQQRFEVKGLIVESKPAERLVTIKHDEIPGYMTAMTMPFEVQDTNLLAGLEPGDSVSFRLVVTETRGYIDRIEKIAPGPGTPSVTGPFRPVRDVEPLEPGQVLPAYHFTNQLAEPISTDQFRGKALAIEFLFTRCPFPNFCPYLAQNFRTVQTNLLSLTNGPVNWHLLTLSFDPEYDTPSVLKVYAERYRYDPAHWTFATGDLVDLTALGEQIGLAFWRDETGSISHNLRVAVFDTSGRLQKIFTGNNWTAEELESELLKAAGADPGKPAE